MGVKRVQPDPYVEMTLLQNYSLKLTPFAVDVIQIELFQNSTKKLTFRASVDDLKALAHEGEQLLRDKLHQLEREQYGVALIVRPE